MKILKHSIVWSIALVLLVAVFTHTHPATGAENIKSEINYGTSTPQFVIFSLDGSKSLEMWRDTREFAKKMNNEGKPIHFTYFINAIYLLTEENKDAYESPRGGRGVSKIGFAESEENIALRVEEIKKAYDEGHEIASHGAGHFSGQFWSEEEWGKEFTSFQNLISDVSKNNSNVLIPDISFLEGQIVGFRAPELGVNNSLYKTLKDFNFLYDASGIGLPDTQPTKDEYGIWHIPLNTIETGEWESLAISMDYSLWILQSNGTEEAFKGTQLWDKYFNDVKNSYLEYFDRNYKNERAPVVIGNHFSLWNDGVYWEAMKSFAEEVCGKKEVYCVTFKEYVRYLNIKNSEPLVKKQ
jgi:peptidoglycan/xylan/chitin deacetylase (PgdA/CDA1 family)